MVSDLRDLNFETFTNTTYTYEVGNRRDPFAPLEFSGSLGSSKASSISELEESAEGVILLGVISGKRGYQALLQLSNGERIMVAPGSPLKK